MSLHPNAPRRVPLTAAVTWSPACGGLTPRPLVGDGKPVVVSRCCCGVSGGVTWPAHGLSPTLTSVSEPCAHD